MISSGNSRREDFGFESWWNLNVPSLPDVGSYKLLSRDKQVQIVFKIYVWIVIVTVLFPAVHLILVHSLNCFYAKVAWRGSNTPAKYYSTQDWTCLWDNFDIVIVLTFFDFTCGLTSCFCLSGSAMRISILCLILVSSLSQGVRGLCWVRCHCTLDLLVTLSWFRRSWLELDS